MGLYIARETMRGAAGDLTVESSEGSTAFSGFVPKVLKAAEEEEKQP
jgi:nitrogen-specific signal transduction histidine kinase